VIGINEKDTVGSAINRLRENGISRLPALDEDGHLVGVVTTNDIVEFVVRDQERQGSGDRAGDIDRMLDIPVYDIMSSPVVTATADETAERPSSNACSTTTSPGWWSRRRELTPSRAW